MIGSFGTPIVWKNEGAEEVVLAGSLQIKGYDLQTGKERWSVGGIAGFVCPTPVLGDGLLFFRRLVAGQDGPTMAHVGNVSWIE
jgi:hypothetical protein